MAAVELKIRPVTEQFVWDDFVFKTDFYTFLQSREWGNVQQSLGEKVFQLGLFKNGELISIAQLIKIKAKRGAYLLCPHGPLFKRGIEQRVYFPKWAADFKNLGKKERVDFIRLATVLPNSQASAKLLTENGFRFAPMHQHAETTWLLNLNKTEKELFSQMRKTTRYLIRRAAKEGVVVKPASKPEDIEKFCELHKKHSQKTGYEPFSPNFIKQLFVAFPPEQISLKFALHQNQVEAAAIVIYYGQAAAYYLAVSDTKHNKFSPAYLLQWQSILEAKARGSTGYNFWGVSPDDDPRHPLAGVSLFKKGFGGEVRDLLHACDQPLTKKYYLNWLFETFRRIKRGYYYLKPKVN